MMKTHNTSLPFLPIERWQRRFIGALGKPIPLAGSEVPPLSQAERASCLFALCFTLLAWLIYLFSPALESTGATTFMAAENIGLFADARRGTPKNSFILGETVWAVSMGMPISKGQQRRFKWISPDGSVVRQSEIVADNQMDAFRIPPSAQVGTWTVKTVDQTNSGFAVASFIVRDPNPDKAVVNLSVSASGPTLVAAGQRIVSELKVINFGPNDAQNVTLGIELASGAAFQSLIKAEGWTCKQSAANAEVSTCSIPLLACGTTAAFKLTYQVEASSGSETPITQTLTVASQTNELHAADNTVMTTALVETPACALSCPADITQPSEAGKFGTVVNYAEPAASAESCNAVDCNPPTGSFFPAGVTTVVCSSLTGRECRFNVRVTGAVAISLAGSEKMVIERHQRFTDPGAMAHNDGGDPLPVAASGVVDLERLGTYSLTYTATDGTHTAQTSRIVQVVDTTPPHLPCPTNILVRLAPDTSLHAGPVKVTLIATDNGERLPVALTPASGSNFSIGATTVKAVATDGAGNQQTCDFMVTMLYRFTGLAPSFGDARAATPAQAGQELPVKFSLSGNKGFNFFAPGYPAARKISCNAAPQSAESHNAEATAQALFSYDSVSDQYVYRWKTESSWAGTCRQLIFKFTDGAEYRADFIFK
jgi:hypothetical protein